MCVYVCVEVGDVKGQPSGEVAQFADYLRG